MYDESRKLEHGRHSRSFFSCSGYMASVLSVFQTCIPFTRFTIPSVSSRSSTTRSLSSDGSRHHELCHQDRRGYEVLRAPSRAPTRSNLAKNPTHLLWRAAAPTISVALYTRQGASICLFAQRLSDCAGVQAPCAADSSNCMRVLYEIWRTRGCGLRFGL